MKSLNLQTNVKDILRSYQMQALTAAFEALARDQHPLIVAPTGSGKSLIIAALCANLAADGKRVLVVTHRKELLEQNERHVKAIAGENTAEIGVYSAGLGRRENGDHILIAGIQSVYKRPDLWRHRDVVIIDEAHLIPPPGQQSMYQTLLEGMPNAARIGLTATPYRLDSNGSIFGDGQWFSDITFQIESKALVPEYLSPLVNVSMLEQIDTKGIKTQRGDYVTSELETRANRITGSAIDEAILECNRWDRKHILVFCVSIAHAEQVCQELRDKGEISNVVHGKLVDDERDTRLAAFKGGQLRWLVNVMVLTTGFDYPEIDTIVMLRPTKSKALHVQCLGRGMRKANGKDDCLMLDFAGNCLYHGDIDVFQRSIISEKKLEAIEAESEAKAKARDRQRNRGRSIDSETLPGKARHSKVNGTSNNSHVAPILPSDLLLDQTTDPLTGGKSEIAKVLDIRYQLTPSKKFGKTNVLISYKTEKHGIIKKWSCPEYSGGALWYAQKQAKARGVRYPSKIAKDFMNQLMTSCQPTELEVSINNRGYWQADKERFG